MFLKKFLYVNWGNIPALEFDFGPINLLSGGNGSGKTTAADAIQTIMTAAHDTLFMYNPGQDEASQRGRNKTVRTLASYVLGCDDGSYARPGGAIGYLAAVFHPTDGEDAAPFTALIGVSASLDKAGVTPVARQNDLQFFIFPGEQLTLSDLIDDKQVVVLNHLRKRLEKKLGQDAVEKYDTKRQYLRRLYGALRGRKDGVSEREALNAARAFSRFMAYKPVKSINGFVANEILEPKDLGEAIRSISDLMKTIYAMESDATKLTETIGILDKSRAKADAYIEQWSDHHVLEYLAEKNRYLGQQKQYLATKEQQKSLRDAISEANNEKNIAIDRRSQNRERLIQLEAQRQGIDALQAKDKYEQSIRNNTDKLHDLSRPLLEQDQALKASLSASKTIFKQIIHTSLATEMPTLMDKNLQQQAKQLSALADSEQIDFNRLMGKDWVDISPLEEHLDQAIKTQALVNDWRDRLFNDDRERSGISLRDQVQKIVDRREQKLQQARRNMQTLQSDIDSLESAQVNYPSYTRQALEAIRRECPQADPRVLCDYVEVIDPKWQNAIEGYIGGARYSILVESEFEAEAISIVRNMPSKDSRARIIQGSKAKKDAQKLNLGSHSIINLMEFEHATARTYLTATYGSVEQVTDAQALANTRRGVTSNGMGSGGYAMFRCDLPDTELVFGQGARERALEAKQAELRQLASIANNVQEEYQQSKLLSEAINLVRYLTYGDVIRDMLEVHRQIRFAEQSIEQLDLSDFSKVESEFNVLKDQQVELDESISGLDKKRGEIESQLKNINRRCDELADKQEDALLIVEQREQALQNIQSIWPEFDASVRLKSADEEAGNIDQSIVDNNLATVASELNARSHELERNMTEHNQRASQAHMIVFSPDYSQNHNDEFFKGICDLQREINRVFNQLKNNILVEKQDKLVKLKDDFNNAFVLNLCHSIYQAINDGKKILESLNKELEHHRFGADQEKYRFEWNFLPEFKEYWDFFKEIINNPQLGEGQNLFSAQLTQKSKDVRDQLMQMLLDEDSQKAMRELERISDYRNYRNYEIYKEPLGKDPIALSQYGTGSGGQLETPAYIIRSAAITSAFRFGEGDNHLRMVLVDEAFSKMDETRSKEVIDYLTRTQGLQLLFIMPTSKSGPFMDLISNQFVFTKVPLPKGQTVGTLNTRVLVDRQRCNEEQIKALWSNHRKIMRKQAELDFLELI